MTILETIPVFEQPGAYNTIVLISLTCGFIFLLIGGILFIEHCDIGGSIFTIITVISLIVSIISVFLAIIEPKVDTGRKQYIIRVNDNTSINEIYENYKIIDHTKYTDVYTVEELKND